MSESTTVLVPVAVLQGESLPEAVIELLASVEVTLLGYHEVPDQTATGQARDQYNPRVQRKLANYVSLFEEYGGQVNTKTVFTHNVENTFERIAIQENITAILLLNPAPVIEQILVPIRGSRNLDQLLSTTAEVAAGTDTEIVCFHAARTDRKRDDGQQLLATATDRLQAAGVEAGRITSDLRVTQSPLRAITEAAAEADFVVMGERKPSVVDRIFGDVTDRIANSSAAPVLVVRKLSAEAN